MLLELFFWIVWALLVFLSGSAAIMVSAGLRAIVENYFPKIESANINNSWTIRILVLVPAILWIISCVYIYRWADTFGAFNG